MSEHRAGVEWHRKDVGSSYSRNHSWIFDGDLEIPASASTSIVPEPFASSGRLDPETAFIGSVSSCHMLWFLSLAEAAGYQVSSYVDHASGLLGPSKGNDMRILSIRLQPMAKFLGREPSTDELKELHVAAHHRCFIANSIKSEIAIAPVFSEGKVET